MSRLKSITNYVNSLHQIPELGFEEVKTSSYLKQELVKLGYEVHQIAITGQYVYIDFKQEKTIAYRCDMDGLPLVEQTNHEYKSKHPNVMHACGHDGHMAIMLQFAKELKNINSNVNVLLIFQPSEERDGGANVIIKEGLFEKYPVSAIYGIHLNPQINQQFIATKAGEFMARSCEWNVTIKTKSTHGAQPHNGEDAIVISSMFVQQIHTIISRNLDPINTGVVTIGTINGGYANNVCASKIEMSGIIRTFSNEDMQLIIKRIKNITKGLEIGFNAKIDLEFKMSYPEVYNDEKLYNKVKQFENVIFAQKQMIAEDFSYYSQVAPSLFAYVGVQSQTIENYPLHNNKFNYEIKDLLTGVDYFINILKTY